MNKNVLKDKFTLLLNMLFTSECVYKVGLGTMFLASRCIPNLRNKFHAIRTLKTEAKVEIQKKFDLHKLDDKSFNYEVELTRDDALKYLTDLVTIRRMEQNFSNLYKEKLIRGFCHLCTGQEACSVGVEASLVDGDSIITAYRSHGWTYTRGVSVHAIAAELLGRVTGCSRGRGGSMHTYGKEFYGGNGIVGSQVPLGAGIALRNKYLNNGKVVICLYGDGAANQGQVFEAYNMAALMKLPVIFVCENNHYAMGTSDVRAAYSVDYYTRGDYIPGLRVDGNCLLSVREATRFCTEYCRAGKGPLVMEFDTYRYFGHSMSDPGISYRTTDEVKWHRTNTDPIKHFEQQIIEAELATEEEIEKLHEDISNAVEEEIEKAKDDPEPSLDELATNVLIGDDQAPIRGCNQHTWHNSHYSA